jgi:hypothetical protein
VDTVTILVTDDEINAMLEGARMAEAETRDAQAASEMDHQMCYEMQQPLWAHYHEGQRHVSPEPPAFAEFCDKLARQERRASFRGNVTIVEVQMSTATALLYP